MATHCGPAGQSSGNLHLTKLSCEINEVYSSWYCTMLIVVVVIVIIIIIIIIIIMSPVGP
jgi:hypothetical protein